MIPACYRARSRMRLAMPLLSGGTRVELKFRDNFVRSHIAYEVTSP
jgi:hypothetical protein